MPVRGVDENPKAEKVKIQMNGNQAEGLPFNQENRVLQENIWDHFENGVENLLVDALAGCGKTTTIMNGLKRFPEGVKVLICAFNKKIEIELTSRLKVMNEAGELKAEVEAKTLHGLGFAFVRNAWKGVRIDKERGMRMAEKALGYGATDGLKGMVAKLASLGKGINPRATELELIEIAYNFQVLPEEEGDLTVEDLAAFARKAMDFAREKDGTIDFDDMVYLPIINNWCRRWYNHVIVDECQDMNASQIELAIRSHKG